MWAFVLGAFLIALLCVIAFIHGASTPGSRTMLDIDRAEDRPEHRDAAWRIGI